MYKTLLLLLLTFTLNACQSPSAKLPIQHLSAQVSELTDNSGLVYIGVKIQQAQIHPYLSQLKTQLGSKYQLYRANQAKRDHNSFHLTLINPYEYKDLTTKVDLNQQIEIELHGLVTFVLRKYVG